MVLVNSVDQATHAPCNHSLHANDASQDIKRVLKELVIAEVHEELFQVIRKTVIQYLRAIFTITLLHNSDYKLRIGGLGDEIEYTTITIGIFRCFVLCFRLGV